MLRLKASRSEDLADLINNNTTGKVSLDDILDFSYEIAIGDEKDSLEEFQQLVENNNGLIKYKNKYVLIDKEESKKIFDQIAKSNLKSMSRMELIHASLSGQLQQYDFDYDAAFARVLSDFTKPVDMTIPKDLKGELRPYQEVGLKWLWTNVSKGFGACMADDMGLGKTIQVISLILKMKEEGKLKKPVLVICPTTLMGNWMKRTSIVCA